MSAAPLPLGTRVRNRRTEELGTVSAPTPGLALREGDVAVRYDDDPRIPWAVPASRLEQIEAVS